MFPRGRLQLLRAAYLGQDALELFQVSGSELLVGAQFVNGDVVLVLLEKGANLGAEAFRGAGGGKSGKVDVFGFADFVLEIGKNQRALFFSISFIRPRRRRRRCSSMGKVTSAHQLSCWIS